MQHQTTFLDKSFRTNALDKRIMYKGAHEGENQP